MSAPPPAPAAPSKPPATSTTQSPSSPKPPAPKIGPMPPKPPVQAPGLHKETLQPAPADKHGAPKKFGFMTKEEIQADLKKEWQPKFKKGCK
jgi:hypothetical protein